MGLFLPLEIVRFVLISFWPENKSFIDQACSAIMAEYRASFLRFYWPRLRLGSQKHAKNLAKIISNHLDLTLGQ